MASCMLFDYSQSLFTLNLIEEYLSKTALPGEGITEKWCKNKNYYSKYSTSYLQVYWISLSLIIFIDLYCIKSVYDFMRLGLSQETCIENVFWSLQDWMVVHQVLNARN